MFLGMSSEEIERKLPESQFRLGQSDGVMSALLDA